MSATHARRRAAQRRVTGDQGRPVAPSRRPAIAYRILADALVVLHLAFVLLVAFGGLLLLRWPRLAWIQVPAAVWGFAISVLQWICPLTPLENRFRNLGGQAGYEGSFIDHYLVPVIYPEGLTPAMGLGLAAAVAAINGVCWSLAWRKWRSGR